MLFSHLLCLFFQNHFFFRKILSGIPSVSNSLDTDTARQFGSSLIWVQTVCKGNQQITLVKAEMDVDISRASPPLKQESYQFQGAHAEGPIQPFFTICHHTYLIKWYTAKNRTGPSSSKVISGL